MSTCTSQKYSVHLCWIRYKLIIIYVPFFCFTTPSSYFKDTTTVLSAFNYHLNKLSITKQWWLNDSDGLIILSISFLYWVDCCIYSSISFYICTFIYICLYLLSYTCSLVLMFNIKFEFHDSHKSLWRDKMYCWK